MHEFAFEIGVRVTLSERGRKNAKLPERRGIVVSISHTGTAVRVRWDLHKRSDLVHGSLLQVCSDGDGIDARISKAQYLRMGSRLGIGVCQALPSLSAMRCCGSRCVSLR